MLKKANRKGILGINIGKEQDTPNDKAADDLSIAWAGVRHCDYITVNISSPILRLRDLQEEETLRRFIGELREVQEELGGGHGHPRPCCSGFAGLTEMPSSMSSQRFNAARIDGVNRTIQRWTGGDAGTSICRGSWRPVRKTAVRQVPLRYAQTALR